MIKRAIVLLSFLSLTAEAALVNPHNSTNDCAHGNASYGNQMSCALMTTFSLPVLILVGEKVELERSDYMLRIVGEMDKENQPFTQAFASENNITTEEAQSIAIEFVNVD